MNAMKLLNLLQKVGMAGTFVSLPQSRRTEEPAASTSAGSSSLVAQLLANEKRLWTDGPEAYREHMSPKCLVALPGLSGVMTNDAVASSVADAPRWDEPDIDVQALVNLTPELALLTYEARATRNGSDVYEAIVSSGYAKNDEGWKMIFHQQTPKN